MSADRPRIYVFGNGNLPFEVFVREYVPALEAALAAKAAFIVCDFRGADTLAMEFLKTRTADVTLLHVGPRPRYRPDAYRTRASQWTVEGGHASDAVRDAAAIEVCTGFIAWDFNTSPKRVSGTRRNIDACLAAGRRRWGVTPRPTDD